MFLLRSLSGMLQFATRRTVTPDAGLPRVRDLDGPTIRLPQVGVPGVNAGRSYTGNAYTALGGHRSPDVNAVPARLTRQHVA